MAEVITVSALNRYVKSLFDANDRLFDLALRGEVANFVQNARSGHCYFTLLLLFSQYLPDQNRSHLETIFERSSRE